MSDLYSIHPTKILQLQKLLIKKYNNKHVIL